MTPPREVFGHVPLHGDMPAPCFTTEQAARNAARLVDGHPRSGDAIVVGIARYVLAEVKSVAAKGLVNG